MGCSIEIQKDAIITNAFKKILDKSGHIPNKIWEEKDFYHGSIKSWLEDNNTEIH